MTTSTTERRAPLGLHPGQPSPRLYDSLVETLRVKHYSRRRGGLQRQIEISRGYHEEDTARGVGGVELPYAFARKSPRAQFEFRWKYVFPADGISTDPRSGERRRHHLHESSVSKAIRAAVKRSDIRKRARGPNVSAQLCHAPDRSRL